LRGQGISPITVSVASVGVPVVAPLVVSVVVALGPACSTDDGFLRKRPEEPAGGAGATAQSDSGAALDGAPSGQGGGQPAPPEPPPVEPDGPRSLTLVHGVVDERGRIVFCLSRIRDGVDEGPIGLPFPTGGLEYGGNVVLADGAPSDLATEGVQLHVIAGEVERVSELECDAALELARSLEEPSVSPEDAGADDGTATPDASAGDGGLSDGGSGTPDGAADAADVSNTADAASSPLDPLPEPPPLRVRTLPLLPAGSLAPERSYLLVLAGCIGGPAYDDPSTPNLCGTGYRPSRPTLRPVLVATSRIVEPTVVGLQVLGASLTTPRVDVTVVHAETSSAARYSIATDVPFGRLAPDVPRQRHSVQVLGADGDATRVEVFGEGSSDPMLEPSLKSLGEAGGIPAMEDGRAYTFVLVGPRLGMSGRGFWNAARMTLVDNDPLR
jgi:hypothetical protein